MIKTVILKQFRGQSGEYLLDRTTVVTGPNAGGKTTIVKAIMVALLGYVPGDEVPHTVPATYESYCGEDDGEMSVEIVTDGGHLVRRYTRHRGKTSCQVEIDGEKVPAADHLPERLGVRVFSPSEFWRAPDSKRVAIVCELADLDPDELASLDDEINEVNTQKRNAMDTGKKAEQAMNDHAKVLQSMEVSEGGVNLSKREPRIRELETELSQIENAHAAAERQAVGVESMKARAACLQEELQAISNSPASRAERMKTIETDDIDRQLGAMDDARAEKIRKVGLVSRLDNMKMRVSQPTPPAYSEADIEGITEQIIRAEQSGEACDPIAGAVYAYGSAIFKEVKTSDIDEASRSVVIAIMRRHIAPIKAKIAAFDNGHLPVQQLMDLRRKRDAMSHALRAYAADRAAWSSKCDEIIGVEIELAAIEAVDHDEVEYQHLRDELAARRSKNADIEAQNRAIIKSGEDRERLVAELSAISAATQSVTAVDTAYMTQRAAEIREELVNLRSSIRAIAAYEQQNAVLDSKRAQVQELSLRVQELKDRETALMSRKAGLISAVQGELQSRAAKVLHPATLEIRLSTGKKASVKFFLNKPGGTKVMREVACGAEAVEFDTALAYALVGDGGLVVSEVSELDAERFDEYFSKVCVGNSDTQVLIVGHSLDRYEGDTRAAFVRVT